MLRSGGRRKVGRHPVTQCPDPGCLAFDTDPFRELFFNPRLTSAPWKWYFLYYSNNIIENHVSSSLSSQSNLLASWSSVLTRLSVIRWRAFPIRAISSGVMEIQTAQMVTRLRIRQPTLFAWGGLWPKFTTSDGVPPSIWTLVACWQPIPVYKQSGWNQSCMTMKSSWGSIIFSRYAI